MEFNFALMNRIFLVLFLGLGSAELSFASDNDETELENLTAEYDKRVKEFKDQYGPVHGLDDLYDQYKVQNLERDYEDKLNRAELAGESTENLPFEKYKDYTKNLEKIRDIERQIQQLRPTTRQEPKSDEKDRSIYGFIIFGIGMALIGLFTIIDFTIKQQKKMDEEAKQAESEARIKETGERILSMEKKLDSEPRNVNFHVGDITTDGPVIIGKDIIIKDSFNTISESNEELASAIEVLSEHIAKSENNKAIDLFYELQEKMAQKNPRKTAIENIWDGLVKILPSIKDLTEVVSVITKYF